MLLRKTIESAGLRRQTPKLEALLAQQWHRISNTDWIDTATPKPRPSALALEARGKNRDRATKAAVAEAFSARAALRLGPTGRMPEALLQASAVEATGEH